ncbi:hypothetical protein BIV25_39940 [Streptomyces sp. MUSC 14]|uniref:hypothetical protein n=1 Tax=Streptomyces sp. MUSC 14 TaxID=1354889 RepID=UPI0008F57A71|nr:hypothetical protein [Streptomyces sp. MUSC 14]OIJ87094.1 hypothetical protein BIV25_39940 [Streptomyces sp. MUSC 14]
MCTYRTGLYPDVTAAGGLGPAMKEAAELHGCDTGLPPWESDVIETARGFLSVHTATEERLFRLRVLLAGFAEGVPGFAWEIGSTGDLGLLVEAVAAWREGMPLDKLKARFEFLELDEFARAIESGEPTSLQWSGLLSSDFHRRQWNLLRRLHADEVLRNMFPSITHGAVRLRVDPFPLPDGTKRQVLVHELDGERYEVRLGLPGADWVEVPTGDLTAYLRAALSQE